MLFNRSFSLQDMCLGAIVRDIDLFIYNKTVPQRHIDFLFRVYSEEVFSKHKSMKTFISEDCMLWFLNPHVKKVTVPFKFHSEKIMKQLQVIGTRLTSLNLHGSEATGNELMCILRCIPSIINLDLSAATSCTNKTLTCIAKFCPHLESLNISFCEKVTDKGMENLSSKNLSLKYLNLLYSRVEAFGVITVLNKMPSIECIKYDDLACLLYEIGNRSMKYNLTELIYDSLDDNIKIIKAWTKMCPKLKKLHFEHSVDERYLKACNKFRNLEELKINGYYNTDVDDRLALILPISNNLKTLILSSVEDISPVTLIENFKNLENLYLKNVYFTTFKQEDIKTTETNLQTLVIKYTKISDATYKAISLLISLSKNVTKLHLYFTRDFPYEIFDLILKSMKHLTVVNFKDTFIEMGTLNQFLEIPSMTAVFANYYEEDAITFAKNICARNASCTLSWRLVYDLDDDNDNFHDDDNSNKYYYVDNSDESDIISDYFESTDSENDDDFWPYTGYYYEFNDDWFDLY